MWIDKNDILSKFNEGELDALTQGDDSIVYNGISIAIKKVKSYLRTGFDVDTIFDTKGDDRDDLVRGFCVDIAIYEICAIRQPGVDLKDRENRKNDAISWLKEVKKGDITPDLPVKIKSDGKPLNLIESGSGSTKRNPHY